MLLYHFGSREGLLVAIVAEVEGQQRAVMETLTGTDEDRMCGLWRQVSDPALRPYVRLFFATVGLAVQGVPGTRALLDTLTDPWLQASEQDGDRAALRLGVAATRGLLLDLLAGADPEEVDAAYGCSSNYGDENVDRKRSRKVSIRATATWGLGPQPVLPAPPGDLGQS